MYYDWIKSYYEWRIIREVSETSEKRIGSPEGNMLKLVANWGRKPVEGMADWHKTTRNNKKLTTKRKVIEGNRHYKRKKHSYSSSSSSFCNCNLYFSWLDLRSQRYQLAINWIIWTPRKMSKSSMRRLSDRLKVSRGTHGWPSKQFGLFFQISSSFICNLFLTVNVNANEIPIINIIATWPRMNTNRRIELRKHNETSPRSDKTKRKVA